MTRRVRGEAGFSVAEVVLVVVVMGLVAAPLALSLRQAITLVPESTDRSTAAGERFFLADTFARDVTNATNVIVRNHSGNEIVPDGNGVAAHSWACSTTTERGFLDLEWTEGSLVDVSYRLTVGAASGETHPVTLTRYEDDAETDALHGFCGSGTMLRVALTQMDGTNRLIHERVHLRVRLQPRADLPVEVTDFEGALGRNFERT